jgi:hypothetical protein
MSIPVSGNFGAYHPYHPYHPYLNLCYLTDMLLAGRDGKDGRGPMVQSFLHSIVQEDIWGPAMIPTKDSLIIQLTVTACRDGKDGRGPMVQSFPLFSIGIGDLL